MFYLSLIYGIYILTQPWVLLCGGSHSCHKTRCCILTLVKQREKKEISIKFSSLSTWTTNIIWIYHQILKLLVIPLKEKRIKWSTKPVPQKSIKTRTDKTFKMLKTKTKWGTAAIIPATLEVEAGGVLVQGQPGQLKLSQNKIKNQSGIAQWCLGHPSKTHTQPLNISVW